MKNLIVVLLVLFVCSVQLPATAHAQYNDYDQYGIQFDGFFVNMYQTGNSVVIKTWNTGIRDINVTSVKQSTATKQWQNIRYVTVAVNIGSITRSPRVANQVIKPLVVDTKSIDTYVLSKIVVQVVNQAGQTMFQQLVWTKEDGIIYRQPVPPSAAGVYHQDLN